MFFNLPLLSILIFSPILGAIVILAIGSDERPKMTRATAVIIMLLNCLLCIPLYMNFDIQSTTMQFIEHRVWVEPLGVNYALGVDGLSLALIMLSTFMSFIVVLAACSSIKKRIKGYMAVFLLMQGVMVGVFAATDAILFYVFWEATLIPIYLAIGIWGSLNRIYASIKFFLYTFAGSALMLVAIIYLGVHSHSFEITKFYPLKLAETAQILLFVGFLLAFAVKIPMWPVHTWLPDAHTEAPTGGSVILAALMLKMGAYGFLRFSLPILPDAAQHLAGLMIVLSLIAVVYIGLVATVQTDMKRLIAYSSISHMGFVTLGCFIIYFIVANTGNAKDTYMALEGGIVQMISHGFSSGALFIAVGVLYDRMHTRDIGSFGGVVNKMPIFTAFFLLFAMTNAGLPGTSGFVGEFMVVLSSYKASFWIAFCASITVILAAVYTLWMYKRVFLGEVVNDKVNELTDINCLEGVSLFLLAFAVLLIGVYPNPLLNLLHNPVEQIAHWGLLSKI